MGFFLDFFLRILIIDKNLGSRFSIGSNISGLELILIIGICLMMQKIVLFGQEFTSMEDSNTLNHTLNIQA